MRGRPERRSLGLPLHRPLYTAVARRIGSNIPGHNRCEYIINDAGELAPYVTFTRSSTATYYGSDGLLKTAAANQPRYDYDPVSLQLKGLLIEEQRTNLLTESEFRNGVTDAPTRSGLLTGTSFSGLTGTTGLAFGHDGSTSTLAYKGGAPASTSCTFSVFVRMDDGNAPTFGNATGGDPSNTFYIVIAGGATIPTLYSVQNLGGGLYRVSTTATSGTLTANTGVVKYNTNNNRTFKISGYQLEAGAFATSYIPTTTAAVTRAADVPSISNLANIGFNAAEGTVFGEASILSSSNSGNKKSVFSLTQGNFNAEMRLVLFNATTLTFGVADNAIGGTQASIAYSVNGVSGFKFSCCYKNNDFALAANGQTPSTDTLGGVTTGIGFFNIGCSPQNSSGVTNTKGDLLNGHIRRLRYYPRRLTNAQLQALTA